MKLIIELLELFSIDIKVLESSSVKLITLIFELLLTTILVFIKVGVTGTVAIIISVTTALVIPEVRNRLVGMSIKLSRVPITPHYKNVVTHGRRSTGGMEPGEIIMVQVPERHSWHHL